MKLNLVPLSTTAATATLGPIPVDTQRTATFAFNVKVSVAASVQLQYTMDDPYAVYPGSTFAASALWINAGAAITASGVIQLIGSTAASATAFQALVTVNTGVVSIQGWQNVTSIT